jgi:biotin carboxyl carrier protein
MRGWDSLVRKFRIKVGDKLFEVEVEEVGVEKPSILIEVPAPPPPPREVTPPRPTAEVKAPTTKVPGLVQAPIPGTIISIKCGEGDLVKAGDPLLVLESMKMENVIYSPKAGRVKKIYVSENVSVNFGDPLVEIE